MKADGTSFNRRTIRVIINEKRARAVFGRALNHQVLASTFRFYSWCFR